MANERITAGTVLEWAVETTSGTMPTTGFSSISNVKTTPDLNPAPATHQVTDLSDLEYHRYIPGLKDTGGNVAFGVNITQPFATEWEGVVDACNAAASSNPAKATWFRIAVPGLTKKFYFSGEPVSLGLPALEVDQVLEGDVYIVPNKIAGWS